MRSQRKAFVSVCGLVDCLFSQTTKRIDLQVIGERGSQLVSFALDVHPTAQGRTQLIPRLFLLLPTAELLLHMREAAVRQRTDLGGEAELASGL